MATPYFQLRRDTVPSTQDIARDHLDELPVLVVASGQSAGRGRAGSGWLDADRALAVSLALRVSASDHRPFSLMAGVAARRAIEGVELKWPNDLVVGGLKAGGILVERSGDVVAIGLGVNLWWLGPPEGATALWDDDPGGERHAEVGGLWGAEMMRLIDADGWPVEEYRDHCVTLGRDITWEPEGSGRAVDIAPAGALVVDTPEGRTEIHSGAVRHIR